VGRIASLAGKACTKRRKTLYHIVIYYCSVVIVINFSSRVNMAIIVYEE
jgi:hypothetical protein